MGLPSSSAYYTGLATDITFADKTTAPFKVVSSKESFASLGAAHGSIRIGWRFYEAESIFKGGFVPLFL